MRPMPENNFRETQNTQKSACSREQSAPIPSAPLPLPSAAFGGGLRRSLSLSLSLSQVFFIVRAHVLGMRTHMIRHASPPDLTLGMSTVSAQYARKQCFQMYVPQFEPRPTCRVYRHLQSRRLENKKRKNRFQLFVSACPPQAETKCLETRLCAR